MFISFLISMIMFMIPMIILSISLIFNFRSHKDREKNSPFECGFDPLSTARLPFSLRFFLLAVLFLVFDIEIVLLLPSPFTLNALQSKFFWIPLFIFLLILILGLLHEWNEGSLEWVN